LETTTTNGVLNLEQLTQPFTTDLIQQRKGRFGQTLDYIGSHHVIERLNEVLKGHWSFKILDREIMQDEVFVLGELTAHGISHQQFGSASVTRNKEDRSIVSIGDDLKAAASDCLKKCATQFGVGLHLYGLDAKPNGNGNGNVRTNGNGYGHVNTNGQTANGNGHVSRNGNGHQSGEVKISNDQIAKIFQVAKLKGMPQSELLKKVRQMFGRSVSGLTSDEAEDLVGLLERQSL
jgi:hypothetical protein